MSYQALYRVWRPQKFSEIVGQAHITKILQNALEQQKISHAYLFSGPRGTGKTSAAKVLAKAVNCENAPANEPCNQCSVCKGITDGSISDVLEIDAASNNGVEEIRDIRDKVKYAPAVAKYKVYIIDEVHMLSTGAFNALLKTLEEPPAHVIFILATTEPHKIPLTIISRCQRFDFRQVAIEDIEEKLGKILNQLTIQYEPAAISVIARAADGGMRDAISMLDQTISLCEEKLTLDDALVVTGTVSQKFLAELTESIVKKSTVNALNTLNELLNAGKDPLRLSEEVIYYYRDMLLYQVTTDRKDFQDASFIQLAESVPAETLYFYITEWNKVIQDMKWSIHPRIFLEVLTVKLCQGVTTQQNAANEQITLLFERLEQLEKQVAKLKTSPPAVSTKKAGSTKQIDFSSSKVPVARIHEILANATKEDRALIIDQWQTIKEKLSNGQSVLLDEAEPIAASRTAFVIKFTQPIHCQMVMDNQDLCNRLVDIIYEQTERKFDIIGIPETEWLKAREQFVSLQQIKPKPAEKPVEEKIVTVAQDLFGEDFVEIKE